MILLDTHAVIWAGLDEPRLGPESRRIIERAAAEDALRISAITP